MNQDLIPVIFHQDADAEWTADRLSFASPNCIPSSASGSQHAGSLGASSQRAQDQQDDDANTSSQNSSPPHDLSESNDLNPDAQPGERPFNAWDGRRIYRFQTERDGPDQPANCFQHPDPSGRNLRINWASKPLDQNNKHALADYG